MISRTETRLRTWERNAGQTLACECLFTDYQLKRGNDGALTFSAPGVLADGTVPTWS